MSLSPSRWRADLGAPLLGPDVSREGVQRDLLPLVEGSTVATKTEGVEVEFAPDGVRRIAEIACQVNERTENIGARRLHTMMERLLESVSYDAGDGGGKGGSKAPVRIDAKYVDDHLGNLVSILPARNPRRRTRAPVGASRGVKRRPPCAARAFSSCSRTICPWDTPRRMAVSRSQAAISRVMRTVSLGPIRGSS